MPKGRVGKPSSSKRISAGKAALTVGFTCLIIVAVWYFGFHNVGTVSESTFVGKSSTDGEDVSNFLEISVWVWDDSKTYDEPEDLRRLANFEEEVSSQDIDDVSIDLTLYQYGVWIEIDPDSETVFENRFIWLSTSSNVQDYVIEANHLSSDVNFNILNQDNLAPLVCPNNVTDANYTLTYDFPRWTATGMHYGDNWDLDSDEWDDLTTSERSGYYDERNYRCQCPEYDPANDTDLDYVEVFEKITNAFAFKFTFNTTVSTVDAASTQVNMTIDDEDFPNWYIQVSGTYIFVVCSETLTAPGHIDFELIFADAIELDSVYSGRVSIAGDLSSATWETSYSVMAG